MTVSREVERNSNQADGTAQPTLNICYLGRLLTITVGFHHHQLKAKVMEAFIVRLSNFYAIFLRLIFLLIASAVALLPFQKAYATLGDISGKGVVYNAATYVGHPSYFDHIDKLNVVDMNWGSGDADCGLALYAPDDGNVVIRYRGYAGGWGNSITWTDGAETIFMSHLSNFGKTGDVLAGQIIGYVGTTGNSSNCHLHIESSRGRLELSGQDIVPEYWYNGPAYVSNGPLQGFDVFDFWQRDSDNTYEASCNEGEIILDAQFKIRNNTGSPIYVNKLALAVHDSSGNHMFDAGEVWDAQQFLPDGGVLHLYPQEIWMTTPGSYELVAKVFHTNQWTDLSSQNFTVVPNTACSSNNLTTLEKSNVVFDYIEVTYGHWFPSTVSTNKYSGGDAYYRYYPSTGSYLYTWIDGHLWYNIEGSRWTKSSTIDDWYETAR